MELTNNTVWCYNVNNIIEVCIFFVRTLLLVKNLGFGRKNVKNGFGKGFALTKCKTKINK